MPALTVYVCDNPIFDNFPDYNTLYDLNDYFAEPENIAHIFEKATGRDDVMAFSTRYNNLKEIELYAREHDLLVRWIDDEEGIDEVSQNLPVVHPVKRAVEQFERDLEIEFSE
jgi:hypothetical protein